MSIKDRFFVLERVMTFVFKAIDSFDIVKRNYSEALKNADRKKKTATATKKTTASTGPKAASKRKGFTKAKSPRVSPTKTKPTPQTVKSFDDVKVTKKLKNVRSGSKISSPLASKMLSSFKTQKTKPISKQAALNGKKSLAWVVWALEIAEQTKLETGVSVHDVSSFLFHAAKIEIYPINVSRMVHDHSEFIQQVSQEKRTKRYLLTKKGKEVASDLVKPVKAST